MYTIIHDHRSLDERDALEDLTLTEFEESLGAED